MLSQIRDKVAGPIGLVILGVIAVSFVFVGATLNFAGNVYAAKVEGSEISIADLVKRNIKRSWTISSKTKTQFLKRI